MPGARVVLSDCILHPFCAINCTLRVAVSPPHGRCSLIFQLLDCKLKECSWPTLAWGCVWMNTVHDVWAGLGSRWEGEWCGANSLNSLIAGSVAGSAVEGCTEELVLLIRRCNCSPNRLVDNLLVCTCFSWTSQPTAFGAESTDTHAAGSALHACGGSLLLSICGSGGGGSLCWSACRCLGLSRKAPYLKEKRHSCPFEIPTPRS